MSRRLLAGVLLAVVLMAAAGALAWRLTGGHVVRVETPSMGTTAPVGSLLWLRPVAVADLEPGDVVTFHPPGEPDTTYSHLVDEVLADDSVTTRGVVSGEDPWVVTQSDVVGRVVAIWPWAGWVVVMAPTLIGGTVVLALVVRRSPAGSRLPLAVVGAALVASVALVVHQPLTRAEQLSFSPDDGVARAAWINTGMLPLRLSEVGGDAADRMAPGEVAEVLVDRAEGGRFVVEVDPALPWWWWPAVGGICFVPAVVETARRRPTLRT